jgi:alpha-amylase
MFSFNSKTRPYANADDKLTIKESWNLSRAVQLVALTAVLVIATSVSVPLGVCLGSDERCGRSASHQPSNTSTSLPLLNDAAAATPVAYPAATHAPLVEDANPLLFQAFEWYIPKDGKHWSRLTSILPQLHQIGVGAIWLPPPTKAATEGSIGYDVYDLWDLGEFNTHNRTATAMGNKSDLLDLAQVAHQWGVGLVIDAALNQRSGADYIQSCAITRLNPDNRLQPINPTKMADVWVGFNHTARGNNYSNKTWSCDDFTAVDYDASANNNGLFKINGHDNDFATDVSTDNGNFDYLLLADVAYDNPAVIEDVKTWGTWITGQLGASGFRMDAVKHISRSFMKDWVNGVSSVIKAPFQSPPVVAEYWTTGLSELLGYVNEIGNVARVFDVPLLGQFAAIANGEAALTTMFRNSVVSTQPDSAVTLVGNHDTQLGQSSANLYVQDWFRPAAYAFILLRQEGTPCMFYGDVYGVCDATGHCNKANHSETVAKLAIARTYFGYGQQHDYNSTDVSTVGWTRQGDEKHPGGLAVTMSIAKTAPGLMTMDVGSDHAGESWIDILGNAQDAVVIDTDGTAAFSVPPQDVSVFVSEVRWGNLSMPSWDFDIYG